jgi:hypothetical protein
VKPASASTQHVPVNDTLVIEVRIAGRGSGTRVVFDLKQAADLMVSESVTGLAVEIRPAAKCAPHTAALAVPRKARPEKRKARAAVEPAPVDLRNVPELPSNVHVAPYPAEGASPPPADRAAAPSALAPQPRTEAHPERATEREFFGDSTSDPAFPAVDIANVLAPPDVAVFAVEDKARALPVVLRNYAGFFAFGPPSSPGYATFLFKSAGLGRIELPVGMLALGDYHVFRISPGLYPEIDNIRRQYGIDPSLNAYALFPDTFDRALLQRIRAAAAAVGRAGRVLAARFTFSATDPSGVVVLQVRVRPPER